MNKIKEIEKIGIEIEKLKYREKLKYYREN